jgi:hypothetical protein
MSQWQDQALLLDGVKDKQTQVSRCRLFGESLPVLKEVLLTLTLGRYPLRMWVFVADITDDLILGLNILCAYDASVDIGCQTLRLADEELSLWSPGEGPRPSSLIVVKDHMIPAQCEE